MFKVSYRWLQQRLILFYMILYIIYYSLSHNIGKYYGSRNDVREILWRKKRCRSNEVPCLIPTAMSIAEIESLSSPQDPDLEPTPTQQNRQPNPKVCFNHHLSSRLSSRLDTNNKNSIQKTRYKPKSNASHALVFVIPRLGVLHTSYYCYSYFYTLFSFLQDFQALLPVLIVTLLVGPWLVTLKYPHCCCDCPLLTYYYHPTLSLRVSC